MFQPKSWRTDIKASLVLAAVKTSQIRGVSLIGQSSKLKKLIDAFCASDNKTSSTLLYVRGGKTPCSAMQKFSVK